MTVEEFELALNEVMNIDFEKYNNGKKFSEEYKKGNVCYQVKCYIKPWSGGQKSVNFLIDEEKVEELKTLVNEINDKIDAIAKEVVSPNYNPCFSYFHRAYWDMGYECHINRRSKEEEERKIKEEFDESPMGQYIKEHGISPCEGCSTMYYGGSCKRCKYGDDGDYSKYDVYSPSELF